MTEKQRTSLQPKKMCEIWAVGGGKGGTGKSFISSSIAIHLAQSEKKVTLIDLDIGGANLHSFLGINQPKKSLTDFFEKKIPLDKLKVKSGTKNLSFIAGDINSLASDSIRFSQKIKLFKHIKKLDSDLVIIDVGAGSRNIFIDTFLIADKKIAILSPDSLAVENLSHFIKNALFRKLMSTLQPYGFKEFVQLIWKNKENYRIKSLWEMIAWLKQNFPFIQEILEDELSNFRIYFLLNQVKNRQEIALGSFIKNGFMRFLDLDTRYLGFVEYDENVGESLKKEESFMQVFPSSSTAQEISTCVQNLIQGKEHKV